MDLIEPSSGNPFLSIAITSFIIAFTLGFLYAWFVSHYIGLREAFFFGVVVVVLSTIPIIDIQFPFTDHLISETGTQIVGGIFGMSIGLYTNLVMYQSNKSYSARAKYFLLLFLCAALLLSISWAINISK